ncbi:MAG: serine/threonine protein kinase, AGC [Thelocarpon impressellum]|nr:MAG: serine/threonine protein kinase, AGC [Thelocarpon impressellum]
MVTATMQRAAAAVKREVLSRSASSPQSPEGGGTNGGNGGARQPAYDLAARLDGREAHPMSPSQIAQDPTVKALGASSKGLQLSDFELLRTLGTGTFARVWLTRLARPSQEERDKVFALKVLRKADIIRLKQVQHVRNEREVLAAVAGHPFITTMVTSFADRDCLYMLLDYCPGGEVFSYLRRAKRFDVPTAQFYGAEIVLILEFLHGSQGVAYRDMKPENLLIDVDGHIRLVDFGFAKRLGNRETYTLCGTPEYLAPEVIQSKGHSTAVDWWAFGILLYEFVVGQPPFWDQNPMKIYEKIVNEPLKFPRGMPREAESLIRALCTKDRTKRLGNISGGVGRVKAHPFFEGIDWDALYARQMQGPIVPHVRHAADTSNFDEYPDENDDKEPYTAELYREYEDQFQDF